MLVSGAVIGAALGFALRRDLAPLARITLRGLPVLVAAVLLRLVAPLADAWALPMEILAMFATGCVAFINIRIPGMPLIVLGSGLNLLTVIVNRGMPVDIAGLATMGVYPSSDGLHTPEAASTLLAALGDVVIIQPLRAAYSVGDIAIALGGFLVSFITLARR